MIVNQIVGCDLTNKMLSQIEDMAAACDHQWPSRLKNSRGTRFWSSMCPKVQTDPIAATRDFSSQRRQFTKMSTPDITAFIQAEGKVRFDQQLRQDLNWEEVLDENRLNHFLKLANISPNRYGQSAS